jgi:hypothetical protein
MGMMTRQASLKMTFPTNTAKLPSALNTILAA